MKLIELIKQLNFYHTIGGTLEEKENMYVTIHSEDGESSVIGVASGKNEGEVVIHSIKENEK